MATGRTSEHPVALIGGTVIDCTGADPIQDAVVIVSGDAIEAVGRKSRVKVPADALVIDVAGQFVIPGLIDLHVHLIWNDEPTVPRGGLNPAVGRSLPMTTLRVHAHALRTLEMGFTTVRDCGDYGFVTVALRDAIESGIARGPRIVSSGQILSCTGGHADFMPSFLKRTDDESNVADGVPGVLAAVRRQVKMTTDWVKYMATGGIMDSYDEQEFTDEENRALVGEAHSKGRPVIAHACYARGTRAAVEAGVDTIEHGEGITEELAELMAKRGTALVPTLYAGYGTVVLGARANLPEAYRKRAEPHMIQARASTLLARAKGVRIGLGTDSGYGACSHGTNAMELQLRVELGIPPMEVLVSATRVSAQVLRLGDRLGTLEAGKWADLVVVNGDPLEDVRILQEQKNIALVMKQGAIHVNRMAGRA
jgi:imidazolonepropionase-like amidohydrolase